MTIGQIYALSMPLALVAMVWLVALFVRRPWTEKPVQLPAQPAPVKRERLLDRLERLNAEIEGNAQLARQQLRQLKRHRRS
ncbi:hypothetical protein BRAS3843_2730067 [Bradyrhizobium sp. STM 3843]|uniref:hypothetical protein n=1 Tax=unclassified Bradyrhizobium TaxID=2631580 RepID=UPI0002403A05|nr:hypothetical protein [Bradyrhizobium sp. STM 3843]CCE08456.1 hypothetical protein BRAS3843_2730067 [Bradyrhizobium sp. STM 3843]